MGGIAAIAKSLGHRVTGSDANVYPPMSTQLENLGIELIQGYGAEQLDLNADIIIVGNAMSRGKPVVEAMLDRGLRYTSGPQWLCEQVLHGRHVIAVAGTHVISHDSAIAVVGNVYTHPTHRGQHLAQATTSAVTSQLLKFCREVVLSVDPTNSAAVRAYERLGYVEVARLIEGAATRRDVLGAATIARRLLARLRGGGAGGEVVRVPREPGAKEQAVHGK